MTTIKYRVRTGQAIDRIKARISPPYAVGDFVNENEISHLLSMFDSASTENKIRKNTGPTTMAIDPFTDDAVISSVFSRIENLIGKFEVNAAMFFETSVPHIIHNDDVYSLPDTYKGIAIPLRLQGYRGYYPKLCFFDQFYFHGPAKFFNGSRDVPTYFNQQIYEYSNVDGISAQWIGDDVYQRYFTHLRREWLEGLSLNSVFDWVPGSAIVFDSVRLHCASDFRMLGISSKCAISIFTRKSPG